ncbi:TolC family protein [Syntrophotalea carbinolica]|nr:TolC family protein [Syntrophotalea carbinolica]
MAFVLVLLAGFPVAAQPPADTFSPSGASVPTLTLNDVLRMALERNLDLQAQQYDTRAGDAEVSKAYGLYDPVLDLAYAEGESRQRLNLQFYSAQSRERYRQFDLGLTQKIPTGADLSLEFTNLRSDQDPAPGMNPSYEGELTFSLVQPLLRGFGSTVTEQDILFAVKDRDISIEDLRESAFLVLADSRDTFFEVLRLRDNVRYREASVALAASLLKENRARVKAGVLPRVDELEAEFGLKQRERDLLDAQREYRDGLDGLALLLDLKAPIALVDGQPGIPEIHPDLSEGYAEALAKRPDVQRRLRTIERLELQSRIARNELLPALDLAASYGHKGLGRDYSDNLRDLGSNDFRNWEVGLTLSYPLGNREARHEYRRSEFERKGREAQLGQLKNQVHTEVQAAIRLLGVSRKKIDVSASQLAFAEEKLRTLLKRKEVGLATTRQVLEGEEDYALAQTDQAAALSDYNKAVTEYYKVTGQLLDQEHVRFVDEFKNESQPLLQYKP